MQQFAFSIKYLKFVSNAYLVPFGIRLIMAVAVFYIGRAIANTIVKAVDKMLTGRMDESLRRFLRSALRSLLLAIVIIAALERLGVQTTAAVAILGAAGLAIGLSLQGTLGNLSAGVMIILFRPYKTGDLVNVAGHTGVVKEIEVFNTVIITPDNRKVIVPNGQIIGGCIENLSGEPYRRLDLVFGIGYGDDMKKAKGILVEILSSHEQVLKDPEFTVAVGELGDSSVNFVVRPWVRHEDYWTVMWDVTEAVKERFDAEGISIPFPQQDVHMHQAA